MKKSSLKFLLPVCILVAIAEGCAVQGEDCALIAIDKGGGAQREDFPPWRLSGPGMGGRAYAVGVNPRDSNEVYIGTDTCGLFKTTDGGKRFFACSAGIYNHYYIADIVVDPSEPSRVYALTWGGLYRSDNRGKTWARKRDGMPPLQRYGLSAPCSTLAIDPSNPAVLYAGIGVVRRHENGCGQIWKSVNYGDQWTLFNKGVPAKALIYRILALKGKTGTVLWAATDHGVFQCTDGETWTPHNSGLPHLFVCDIAAISDGTLYAALRTIKMNGKWVGGIYVSKNGDSWERCRGGDLPENLNSEGCTVTHTFVGLRVDRSVTPNRLYAMYDEGGFRSGLYRLVPGVEGWRFITRLKDGPCGKKNMELGWRPGTRLGPHGLGVGGDGTLYASLADNLFVSSDRGESWRLISSHRVRVKPDYWAGAGIENLCSKCVAAHPLDKNTWFLGVMDQCLFYTRDGGRSFRYLTPLLAKALGYRHISQMRNLFMDPWDWEHLIGLVIKQGCANKQWGVVETRDNGETWKRIPVPGDYTTPAELDVQFIGKNRPPRLFLAFSKVGVLVSGDGGRTWQLRAFHKDIQDLYVTDRGELYIASYPNGIFHSNGTMWEDITGNLGASHKVRCIIRDPLHGALYVGTVTSAVDSGIWRCVNKGRWNLVFRYQRICGLNYDPYYEEVYACCGCYSRLESQRYRGLLVSVDNGRTWKEDNRGIGTSLLCRNIVLSPILDGRQWLVGPFSCYHRTDPRVRLVNSSFEIPQPGTTFPACWTRGSPRKGYSAAMRCGNAFLGQCSLEVRAEGALGEYVAARQEITLPRLATTYVLDYRVRIDNLRGVFVRAVGADGRTLCAARPTPPSTDGWIHCKSAFTTRATDQKLLIEVVVAHARAQTGSACFDLLRLRSAADTGQ